MADAFARRHALSIARQYHRSRPQTVLVLQLDVHPPLALLKDFHVVDSLAARVGPLGRDCHHFAVGGDGSRPGNDDLGGPLLRKLRTGGIDTFQRERICVWIPRLWTIFAIVMTVYDPAVGFPVPSTPFELALISWPATTYVRVSLFGAGPGVYFDLATLSCHLPTKGSAP